MPTSIKIICRLFLLREKHGSGILQMALEAFVGGGRESCVTAYLRPSFGKRHFTGLHAAISIPLAR